MINQILITIFGVLAIWMSQSKSLTQRKYACIFGLVGQPFWIVESYISDQWGIFILSFVYTFCWMKGIFTYWRITND